MSTSTNPGERRSLVGDALREAVIGLLRPEIESWPIQPVCATLFGSVARGEANEDSDVDLLVVFATTADQLSDSAIHALRELGSRIAAAFGHEMEPLVLSQPNLDAIVRSSRGFLAEVVTDGVDVGRAAISDLVSAAEARRIRRDGAPTS